MKLNPLSMTDFYKTGHRFQYPERTELVYSNATCRSANHFKGLKDFDGKVVNFGLQGICQWMLIEKWNRDFFQQPKEKVVGRHKRTLEKSLNVKDFDVSHLEALHDLGYLPIVIKALPEGARVNIKVPTYTITNTHPNFGWLTNYLETQIQSESWKPKVSASTAYEFRRLFEQFAEETGVDKAFVDFQGHDFSMRGMSGIQDATQSGAGHLLSFKGTDTVSSIEYLEDYYDAFDTFVGGSVPATEHAVMCLSGQDGEISLLERLLTTVYPAGIVSIVSDTWDFWKVVTEYTVTLKDKIMSRDGKMIIRPDSGDPVDIICGSAFITEGKDIDDAINKVGMHNGNIDHNSDELEVEVFTWNGRYFAPDLNEYKPYVIEPDDDDELDALFDYGYIEIKPTPEMKGAVECLWDIFEGTETDKGFKTLDSHIGLIYGDSINLDRAKRILEGLKAKGFSSANIVFGIGSFTYQFVTRDTFGEAVKATFGIAKGEAREIFKDPKTGDGGKKSAKGLIRVEKEGDDYVLYDQQTWEQEGQGELTELFHNSKMSRVDSLDNIRNRLLGTE